MAAHLNLKTLCKPCSVGVIITTYAIVRAANSVCLQRLGYGLAGQASIPVTQKMFLLATAPRALPASYPVASGFSMGLKRLGRNSLSAPHIKVPNSWIYTSTSHTSSLNDA